MNRRFWVFTVLGLAMLAVTQLVPRRADARTVVVSVPEMAGERDVRIVTNAALDEIRGRYDGVLHEYRVDLERKVLLYHEGPRLLQPGYQREIEARIREIGQGARIVQVAANPHPPLHNTRGETMAWWTDRVTAVIALPDLGTRTDANRIVDAIARARTGDDPAHIVPDRGARTLTVTFDALKLAPVNLEHAIACSGYAANGSPARLGRSDALAHGWTPLQSGGF